MGKMDGASSIAPDCNGCRYPLNRVDHYAIGHTILDGDVYREVHIGDGKGNGLAAETDLRCAHCGHSLTREQRMFFYQRWIEILAMNGALQK